MQPPNAQPARPLLEPRGASYDAKDPWLYVTGHNSDNVVIYDLRRRGFPKIGEITDGVSGPNGVTVDAAGQVYVANSDGSVSIYNSGATTPKLTLKQDLTVAESVAVDASGSVYVCNRGTGGSIVVFPRGQNIPSQVITNTLIKVPSQIQVDGSGNLFYADFYTGVSEIPSHSMQMSSLNLRKLQMSEGLALDPTDGNLFVGTSGGKLNGVRVYPHNQQSSIRTLKNSGSGNLYSSGKVDGTEYIFIRTGTIIRCGCLLQTATSRFVSCRLRGCRSLSAWRLSPRAFPKKEPRRRSAPARQRSAECSDSPTS
jgi:sugar lactone lactonase YvrE